ncbi:hypothetical protein IPC201_07875 [Pseudomonas aeruginosa]|nr:hypothetical protein IPC201_07875 [Pseudomonas aeruginosa]
MLTLRHIAALEEIRERLASGMAASTERASALARYATRESKVTGATWSEMGGIAGWSTGDCFFAGVTSPQSADREMARFAASTKRGGHPIDHLVVSWPAHEQPPDEQLLYSANQVLTLSGVPPDCPRVLAVHRDTDNVHVHAILSRYRPAYDKVWSAPRWLDSLHRATRKVEIEMGFSHDNGNAVVVEIDGAKTVIDKRFQRAQLSAEAAAFEARQLKASFERYVRESRHEIEKALNDSRDWNALHRLLAARLGIGLRRHGAGLVITNLSGPEVNTKASFGGLSAPSLESFFGAWQQLREPSAMKALRTLASVAPSRYQPGDAVTHSRASTTIQQTRKDMRARVTATGEVRETNRLAMIQNEFERALLSAGSGADRRRIEREFAQRRRRELEEEHRARRAALEAVDRMYAARQRTPLQLSRLDPDAIDSGMVPSIPRAGAPALLVIGIQVRLFIVQLPGLQAMSTEQGIEYRRSGDTVIRDDGARVHVHSEVSADIEDALAILLATRPEAAERGVTITGSDEFRDRAMCIVAQAGLTIANADHGMQQQFAFIQDNLKAELALPTADHQQHSRPSMG